MNPLLELEKHGQSVWLDNLTRGMIRSGELERRVREEGIRGVTSNPSIFQKAISAGEEYDEDIRRFVREGMGVQGAFEGLAVRDIRDACDVLRPVYDDSGGTDGFVSLEVSPYLAHDTQASLDEARRLFRAVDRPNVFIKIPGTAAGVPAIEEALFEGININITLLFSIESYEAVAEAYMRALERRLEAELPVDRVASVASFFLSRIDVLADQLLGHRIRARTTSGEGPRPEELLGRVAIANAKLAYRSFREMLDGDRWRRLEDAGARPQRMLWASTSTKNPLYRDIRYVEPLIGPHTVNTMPGETVVAFGDHGRVEATVEEGVQEARRVMRDLPEVGVDFDRVTAQLENEGVEKFIQPFDELMATLAERRARILGGCLASLELDEGDVDGLEDGLDGLDERRFGRRLREGDPVLWTDDPEEAAAIGDRLGWEAAPEVFRDEVEDLERFAREVREDGVQRVVLFGMGGSSLSAEVARDILGSRDGWPELHVLDDTDPDAVEALAEAVNLSRTLFLVASKSGTTAETTGLYRAFWDRVADAAAEENGGQPGSRFVAITDPGTPLAREARERGFRRVFENPEDIGGRYSALSYFGLVPMALLGADLGRLLDRALDMRRSCDPFVPARAHPAFRPGVLLALAAKAGRDKVTIVASEALAPFGAWAEQLLAESTGKEGKGLVPVDGEPGAPEADGPFGADRVFVHLRLEEEPGDAWDRWLEARASEGHPTVRIVLDDRYELGAEFYRWEVATAAAGAILGVNPFDEPNVAEAKRATADLLEGWASGGGFDEPGPDAAGGRLSVWTAHGAADAGTGTGGGTPEAAAADGDPGARIRGLLSAAAPGDYVAVLAYLRSTPETDEALRALRRELRDRTGLATTVGRGPRYLHSTGQLHKGGPPTGIFLLLTADPAADVEIPGEAHGFATLQRAQALGDFRALADHGRRVARVHLGDDPAAGLADLLEVVREAEPTPVRA